MRVLILVLLHLFVLSPARAQAFGDYHRDYLTGSYTIDDLRRDLAPRDAWRPYPAAGDAGWDAVPEPIRRAHRAEAEALLGTDWPALPATVILEYVRTGNRSHYQALSYQRRTQLAKLVVAEAMENRGRFIDDIVNGIWAICEESYWGVPAHLSMQEAGSGLPDVNEPTVDLFAAETAHLLAWTLYFLEDRLAEVSPVLVERIYTELDRRILTPNLERDDFWWMGFSGGLINNWNPWVNSNWLATVLLAERDPERRLQAVYKIMRSLDRFINIYPEDGGCDEGPSYWGRAAASMFDTLDLLDSATSGAVAVYDKPVIGEMGRYIYRSYIAGEYFINFADAGAKITVDPAVVYRYGARIGDEVMMRFAAFMAQRNGWGQGYIPGAFGHMNRQLPALFVAEEVLAHTPQEPQLRQFWLSDIQVMGARGGANGRAGFYVAAKGGHNDESHNHNDVGNFIVYHNGSPVLIDIGAGEYTAATFSKDRYTIWNMQSAYHNVPTINGLMQREGRSFEAKEVSFKGSGSRATLTMDLAGAYPDEAHVRSWKRTVEWRSAQVTVRDSYAMSRALVPNELNLMTPREPRVVAPGRIELPSPEAGQPSVFATYNARALDADIQPIPLDDPRLQAGWGPRVYRIVLRDKMTRLEWTHTLQLTAGSR
ncbi:MAG: heparinase II/III family protein [Rhodothermales bacterium]